MVEKRNIVTFQIDDELAERLDDYRFENRINTRSDAIRKLLDEALKKHEKKDK
jgi:metal-responsive CopG/Arc/MetJ family transcriptional regulator